MRASLILVLILTASLAGCSHGMQGEWPSLAPRAGETAPEGAVAVTGPCAGCGQDVAVAPALVAPVRQPLPADVQARLTNIVGIIAGVEAKVPAQARTATAAINAARRDAARSGDAEVERSRYEALFMPLSIEDRQLEVLSDDVVGRDGADAVLAQIADLRARLAALDKQRTALPE